MRALGRRLIFAVPLMIVAGAWWGALADDRGKGDDRDRDHGRKEEKLVLKKTIDVHRAGLGAFDISFVDPAIELYVLADRTNGSIDLVDSDEAKLLGHKGDICPAGNPAPHFCFQGVVLVNGKVNNNLSGPDGVVIVGHKEIWAGDGDSRMKVIDIATKSFVTTITTGGSFRVDEMADDPRDHLIAAANNADSPPFVTMFDTKARTVVGQIIFDNLTGTVCPAPDPTSYKCGHAGVDAQNGIEQPQWSPETGLFYVSVPQVGPDPTVGGVSVIDPITMAVTHTFLVKNCGPNGLALGPHHQALLGCGATFGTTPKQTQSVVIDITSTSSVLDGAVVATVPIGGSDEVWYDSGTKHYFLAARANLDAAGNVAPILGSIDALTNKLDPSVATSTTAHSVAADKNSHNVFVPIGRVPTGTDATNPCPQNGCIAVFRARSDKSDDDFSRR